MSPLLLRIGGALALLAAGFGAGWTTQGWRRDSMENAALKQAARALGEASAALRAAGDSLEEERTDEGQASQLRQSELRIMYRDAVPRADCAAPDGVGRVLGDAVARANARAAGEPLGPVPAASGSPGAAGGP